MPAYTLGRVRDQSRREAHTRMVWTGFFSGTVLILAMHQNKKKEKS